MPILALAALLMRRWKPVVALAAAGALFGLLLGLSAQRVYKSTAMLIPEGSEATPSGLAAAASQLGLRVPSTGSTWGAPVYVELLRSDELLEPVVGDSVVVREQGNKRVSIIQLLGAKGANRAEIEDAAIVALRKALTVSEVRTLGAVQLSVATRWPSVSLALAQRLIEELNRFNLDTRKSRASAERQFVEIQAREADSASRETEARLRNFLQRNRVVVGSPELEIERDRLQRDVNLRQQVYLSLLQSREEAKIREVRDIPLVTVLEHPRLPIVGEPRGSIQKAFLGGVAGLILGVLLAFLLEWLPTARAEYAMPVSGRVPDSPPPRSVLARDQP